MLAKPATQQQLHVENDDLRARLAQAEEMLREMRCGEVDALVVPDAGGVQLFAPQDADQSFRTLIESMSEGALTLTPAGLVLYANRRFAAMLGVPLEKVIGSEIGAWFPAERQQALQALLKMDAIDNRREESALAGAEGTRVPVYLSVSRIVMNERDSVGMVVTDLTEQQRNAAILATERLSNAILEQAGDAIVICDKTGRIIRASKQAQAFFGESPFGLPFEQAFPLRQPDGSAFSAVAAIDPNRLALAEARLDRNAQGFDFLVSVGHLRDARGDLLGSVVTLTDITKLKSAELALQQSKTQLSEALAIARIGYWEYEFATYEFVFNDQYYVLHKITAADVGGYRMSAVDFATRFVYPADAEMVGRNIQSAYESQDPEYFAKVETRILTGTGEIVWVEVRFRVQRDKQGKAIRLIGVNQDITERKQREQEVLATNSQLHGIFDAIPDLLFEMGLDGRYHACHSPRTDLLAAPAADLLLKSVADVLPAAAAEIVMAALHEADATGRSAGKQFELALPQGRLWFELSVSRMEVAAGQEARFICLSRDITERKAAEVTITRLNRVYALLSGINTLIVRVRDRDELFKETCRIAVEKGGFHIALIAIGDRDTMTIASVVLAGMDERFLTLIKERFSLVKGTPLGNPAVAQAIKEQRTIVITDLQSDPELVFRQQYAESGIRSVIILPLIVSNEAVGALVLYANESEFFQEEELKLLTELAGDIAFAIDHIDKQERLNYLAYYDVLTGLANRTLFLERVAQYMRSAASDGHQLALYLIDLERFKNINDSLGRPAGDALLQQVAQWLKGNAAGDINLLARIGPDLFAVVMPVVRQGGDLTRLLEKWIEAFQNHPFHLNDAVFRLAAKLGIAVFPDDGADAETLFKNAEAALKAAKASGERYLFYKQKMTAAAAGKLTMENQLRQALNNEEFVLHYQPKVNLASGKMTSAEALIRWNDPRTGLVPPGRFIPILEETGLIYDVGRWALHQAIKDYLRWRSMGLPAVRIAVNVSPLQLRHRGFVDEIRQVVDIGTSASAGLELEITESVIMEDVKGNIASLRAIRDLGVSIAIDDFGTGFSSLSYLARLPVDTLKIDRSFVIDMTAGPEGLALVSTIINLAHSLKLKVVAEGVETEDQSRLLRLLSCDEMQGFLFSKPVPTEIFETKFLTLPHAEHARNPAATPR